MSITIDLFLYGELANYAVSNREHGYSNIKLNLTEGSTVRDVLASLGIPTQDRGVTFINGQLSAMPGRQPDLDHALNDNDRVAFFDLKSMWPFQYRYGAAMTDEMKDAGSAGSSDMHHSYHD